MGRAGQLVVGLALALLLVGLDRLPQLGMSRNESTLGMHLVFVLAMRDLALAN